MIARYITEVQKAIATASHGRLTEISDSYQDLAERLPDNVEARAHFGQLALLVKDHERAIPLYQDLVNRSSDNVDYHTWLGKALLLGGHHSEAEKPFLEALHLQADHWPALTDLGALYTEFERYDEAIPILERVAEIKPSDTSCYANLAICMLKTRRHHEALKQAEKALKLDKSNAGVYHTLGCTLTELGRIDEAIANLGKAIRLDRTNGSIYYNMSRVKKFRREDRPFIKRIENILTEPLTSNQRRFFLFALAKAYDDMGDWDLAFKHYRLANMLASTKYRETPIPKRYVELQKRLFTSKVLSQASDLGDPTTIPVFIVGMPRSGTTLIEQIIARHSRAAGAGELPTIHHLANGIAPPFDKTKYLDSWGKKINREQIQKLAKDYLQVLQQGRRGAAVITDKMPENYLHMGFISLLFPYAKFIHAIRNPLDTCLSCYFQSFDSIDWSFDLEWIARRYHFYREVIAFWKSALPSEKILEVAYESLIEKPDSMSQRIIAHCGLEWEPECLDHRTKERVILTASVWQARQPIYKTSLRRWHNYVTHLEPLAKGLAEYLSDEDRNYLEEHGIIVKRKRRWFALGFA